MVKVLLFLLSLVFLSPSYAATIYYWVDKKGVANFTDTYERIPSEYRSQIQIRVMEDASHTESPVQASTPKVALQKEEERKDILGQGEEKWLRERAHPWEKQLKEGKENLEAAREEFVAESEKLIIRKFGSHQQFKSTILNLEGIKEVAAKHEAQIAEAKDWLERLSKEAEESKANPEWPRGVSVLQITPSDRPETKTDIYGRDEVWWRGQFNSKAEELTQAIQDYERTYEEYIKKVESLGPSRFGRMSLTQYQMMSGRLENLSNEMAEHQARIIEIKNTVKKLTKEAEEFKANLDWLK
jgi:hypothetical protein